MEDKYITPGNQERGWNDPPQFSYGLQMARGPQRNLLNKRAAPVASAGAPPTATLNPGAPPPMGPAPPPAGSVAPPPPSTGPIRSQKDADSSQSQREPDVEEVMSILNEALTQLRPNVPDQVCKDVAKRLRLLEDGWRSDRLSLPVKRRMDALSLELRSGNWDAADELHRSLMVDHVTEVSQWMVGVKRLIAETRKLKPELSEPVQDPTKPVQDPTKPVQDPTKPVQDPTKPVQDPVEPVQDPVEPVQDPAEDASVSQS